MNVEEIKKFLEERLVEVERKYRSRIERFGIDNKKSLMAMSASCELEYLYEDLFGKDEFEKLMEENFPEDFED